MKRIMTLAGIAVLIFSVAGCGGFATKMNRLQVSMNKDEVRALFGNNFNAKASKVDTNGNILDLWEFYDEKTKATYQIYFLNDRISQWGRREELNSFPELHAPTYRP